MTNARVNEIDLLRFIAAMAVVFYHYAFRGYAADNMTVMPYPMLAPVAKYGYLGVDLFFMLSGFVILMTATGSTAGRFLISRAIRLYPAFWACCTITFIVTVAIGLPRYSASISRYLANMTMLTGFFDIRAMDEAYWSLLFELKFYAAVAAILLIGKIRHAQSLLAVWLVASIALQIFPAPALRQLLMADFSAYFIGGAAFFLIWSQGVTPARIAIVAAAWMLALYEAIHNMLPFALKHYNTEFNGLVISVTITIFFAVMLMISLKRTGAFGDRRWLLAGAVTYPLYLVHHNVGYMIFNTLHGTINPHVLLWGTVAIMLGLAWLVHVCVEKRLAPVIEALFHQRIVMPSRVTLRRMANAKALEGE